MSIFTPPKTNYPNHFDQSRFKLVWNISFGIMLLLLFLTLLSFNLLEKSTIPNVIGLIISIVLLFIMRSTRKYRLTSKIGAVSSCILLSNTFFYITDHLHYITPLWIILNILFTFFTLGKTWGVLISLIHFFFFSLYIGFRLNFNMVQVGTLSTTGLIILIVELAIVGAAIIYLIWQFILTYNKAETAINNINHSLVEQNKIISYQNDEKNVMLKEIHHRVKNNLQVITSLLRLQSHEIEDPKHISYFDEAINRVKSMSLIHEKMYQNNLFNAFDFENYIQSLAQELISAYSFETKIELEVETKLTTIGSKNIVSISLLFNELISNSIKHAFKNNKEAKISISLSKNQLNDSYTLIYKDNGKWSEHSKPSFGTELIAAMAEQLEGSFELSTNGETKYVFLLNNLSD